MTTPCQGSYYFLVERLELGSYGVPTYIDGPFQHLQDATFSCRVHASRGEQAVVSVYSLEDRPYRAGSRHVHSVT